MLPIKALRLTIGTLLAAAAAYLAPATDANEIMLIKDDFVEDENLVIGDLTPADFDGYAAISGATGAQLTGVDPITGEQLITIKEPLGGWRWVSTGVTNLPQTIYGYALTTDAGGALIAVKRLDVPITIQASGEQIDIGAAVLRIVVQPIS